SRDRNRSHAAFRGKSRVREWKEARSYAWSGMRFNEAHGFDRTLMALVGLDSFTTMGAPHSDDRRDGERVVPIIRPAVILAVRAIHKRWHSLDRENAAVQWRFFGDRFVTEAQLFRIDVAQLAQLKANFEDSAIGILRRKFQQLFH